ncbi:type II toxin-antitoxin system VapC family toxin [Conexibacter stalactiti]|uniref:Ribonuclease VapC n=1 Tax=Conexibacter stalactiti TaxID=1940611 RepID=A0ABU4HYD0_9ACTN|nr:type II toxin-antitoxin system VapC family toxin [Conexibacter stalactiti]MDW5598243.1 type II toxin-antitoxin system VapC family toxin [Conexibacter stalactiti]MEC5038885.1 type II toxin-antitoxin system VapC family toxin [Conexibacter stalactiti]
MTFFVDANVILYAAVPGEQQASCLRVLDAVAAGADGRTSVAVLEEAWHVARSGRLGDLPDLAERAYRIFTPLLPVTDEAFAAALALDESPLGANDRLHAGTCLAHGIETIVTADRGFDAAKAVRRIDPTNARAMRRLLGS